MEILNYNDQTQIPGIPLPDNTQIDSAGAFVPVCPLTCTNLGCSRHPKGFIGIDSTHTLKTLSQKNVESYNQFAADIRLTQAIVKMYGYQTIGVKPMTNGTAPNRDESQGYELGVPGTVKV